MTNRLWCGWPDKSWKGAPAVCPCGWVFPERFHPNRDGSWPLLAGEGRTRNRERLPEPEPPRRKRERLDLFDDE